MSSQSTKIKINKNDRQTSLKILHQNINGLTNKIDLLVHFLEDTQPDILILTEHGLKDDHLKLVKLPNYSLVTSFCRKFHKMGGVAIFLHERIEHIAEPLSIMDCCEELTCEMALVKLSLKKSKLFILGIYRPPGGNLENSLDLISEAFENSEADNHKILMMGDINIDCLKEDSSTTKLNHMLSTHGIERKILPPTRITPATKTSIDCICSNILAQETKETVVTSGLSDHTAQFCTLKTEHHPRKSTFTFCRSFKQENLDLLSSLLKDENWQTMYNSVTAEESYNNFIETLKYYLNLSCPKRKIKHKKKHNTKYFSDNETKRLKAAYLDNLNKYETSGKNVDKENAVRLKKQYDLRLRELRKISSENQIMQSENKSKTLWQIINQERGNKLTEEPQIKLTIDGKVCSDPLKIANNLNSYFADIAAKTLGGQIQKTPKHLPKTTLPAYKLSILGKTNHKEIEDIIMGLKTKTSSGIDEISSKILKYCCRSLTPPLVNIVNKSLEQGQFPSALKLAKVYPKHKSGCKREISNYRPISLISTFSKVMEKVVLKRLMNYCEQHSLITNRQHGFLKGKSTTTAIIELTEFVIDNIESGKLVTGILLDFSKAFDCLGHNLILQKLESLGVKDTALAWFESYLKGRKQTVEIKSMVDDTVQNIASKPLHIDRGVPQGSVLGPVLFILFTNDMPTYLETLCTTLMYADDTTLLLAGENSDQLGINSFTALNMAYQYCHTNDLAVNPKKTNQLAFGRRKDEVPAIPDVEWAEEAKFLGVTIDSSISWGQHIENLLNKLNSSIYVIKRIKHISNTNSAKTAYHALFESHVNYGLAVWGGTSAGNLQKVLVTQKRAIRILAGLNFRDSCKETFKDLKILTVIALYARALVLHIDATQPQRGSNLHSHNTRHGSKFNLPAHHLTLFERKPSYMGMKIHNSLPEEIRSLTGKGLKTALTNWLADHPFYSMDELINWRNH